MKSKQATPWVIASGIALLTGCSWSVTYGGGKVVTTEKECVKAAVEKELLVVDEQTTLKLFKESNTGCQLSYQRNLSRETLVEYAQALESKIESYFKKNNIEVEKVASQGRLNEDLFPFEQLTFKIQSESSSIKQVVLRFDEYGYSQFLPEIGSIDLTISMKEESTTHAEEQVKVLMDFAEAIRGETFTDKQRSQLEGLAKTHADRDGWETEEWQIGEYQEEFKLNSYLPSEEENEVLNFRYSLTLTNRADIYYTK